jgi:hypothetical protein
MVKSSALGNDLRVSGGEFPEICQYVEIFSLTHSGALG